MPQTVPQPKPHSRKVLGVRIDDVTYDEALDVCRRIVEAGVPRLVATVNPEFVMIAQRNRHFAAVLSTARLSVPDGVGLRWACKFGRRPIRQVVHGIDLVERLAGLGSKLGWRFYFLGAREGIAAKAAAKLHEDYPDLIVTGTYSGSPSESENDDIVRRILANERPDVLLVAYGAPSQELWIDRNRDKLGIPLSIGVGGTFDYISGEVQRAPDWIVRLGFEWLHRLIRQPWRWRRQIALIRFVLKVVSRQILSGNAVTPARRPDF